jgi:hypothetical protein
MLRLRSATGIKLRMTNYFKIPKSEATHEINSPLKREVGGVSAVQTPITGHFDSAQCPETRPFIHHSPFIIPLGWGWLFIHQSPAFRYNFSPGHRVVFQKPILRLVL